MNRDELLLACFGRDDLKPGKKFFAMTEGDQVLANVDLSYRRVIVGRTTVTVAAISNVCTDPAYRGLGYASALLRSAHNEVKDHPMVLWAAVFAADSRLFEPLGYRQVDPVRHSDLLVAQLAGEPWPAGLIDVRGGW